MQEVLELEAIAELCEKEAHIAIQFHETWKPSAFNREMHKRISFSYAAHTFEIVRWALSRELLMSLGRLWIPQRGAISLTKAENHLKSPKVFDAICSQRMALFAEDIDSQQQLKEVLLGRRDEYFNVLNKYLQGGEAASILKKLTHWRHNELAHRRLEINNVLELSDESNSKESLYDLGYCEIEQIYQDSLNAVSSLLDLVHAKGANLKGIASVYSHHSTYFWDGLQSEREVGHPRYIAPKGP